MNVLKAAIVDVLQVDEERVVRNASFAGDLDADSLDLVELTMTLEEAFGINIDESELEDIVTVQDALNLILRKLEQKDAG